MHMVGLGVHGVELLQTGRISLPIAEPRLTWLRDLRQGRHTKNEALEAALDLERQILVLIRTSPLPEGPDDDVVDGLARSMSIRAPGRPSTDSGVGLSTPEARVLAFFL
jgi:uncharacterized protein